MRKVKILSRRTRRRERSRTPKGTMGLTGGPASNLHGGERCESLQGLKTRMSKGEERARDSEGRIDSATWIQSQRVRGCLEKLGRKKKETEKGRKEWSKHWNNKWNSRMIAGARVGLVSGH